MTPLRTSELERGASVDTFCGTRLLKAEQKLLQERVTLERRIAILEERAAARTKEGTTDRQ
jgi:hypothetical protein